MQKILTKLFESWAKEKALIVSPLPISGSDRRYFRISSENKKAIAAFNPDEKENETFIKFTNHFWNKNRNVPKILAQKLSENIYLQEDLGDKTLLNFLEEERKTSTEFPQTVLSFYKKAIQELIQFQLVAGKDLNYNWCFSRPSFDKQSMLWDLNYFKYYFLKPAKIAFDEQALENDFHAFSDYLLQADCNYFLFRDFQARNIMIHQNKTYFIDYQGGRKGALQYDLASLLYQARAKVPDEIRTELLDFYIQEAQKIIAIDEKKFREFYQAYVLIRIIQTLGAYGFRGWIEQKEHFLKSIPSAVQNLKNLLQNETLSLSIPHLKNTLMNLPNFDANKSLEKTDYLKITINSFSYKKKGIPKDETENGGGFVFDCRAIHNPGRYEPYKELTGRDASVIDFFKKESRIDAFLEDVKKLVEPSIEKYLERNFTSLMVNFGCTGGQHRSVYCAENLAKHLIQKYPQTKITLNHIEQDLWDLKP